jgi:hypothetical protein
MTQNIGLGGVCNNAYNKPEEGRSFIHPETTPCEADPQREFILDLGMTISLCCLFVMM